MHLRTLFRSAAIAGLLAVTACSGDKFDPDLPCPRVAVVTEAATMTRFLPGQPEDVVNVDFTAEFADLPYACVRDEEELPGTTVVGVAPVMVVNRGLGNRSGHASLSYFVSVVDTNDTVLQRQSFNVAVTFAGNRSRVIYQDSEPPISIDLKAPKPGDVLKQRVLIGFQLTPNELDYNRKLQNLGR